MKKGAAILTLLVSGSVFVFGQSTEQKHSSQIAGGAKADLVPFLHHPMDGKITVKNIGTAPAGPSKLTLDCVKVGAHDQMNSCPDLPPSVATTYFDPLFPKNATIQVPPLTPGESFTHSLSFWGGLAWPKGKYKFIAVVDAAHAVPESNTSNNVATSLLTVP